LIGEELFAAAAYVSQDPTALGSIVGQDALRVIILGVWLVGWLANIAGITGLFI
jgi:hypothetical protein